MAGAAQHPASQGVPAANIEGLLALDTSGEHVSVALHVQGKTLSHTDASGKAAERLLPAVELLLAQQGADWSAIKGLVVGLGPGSFMGVRTACSVAQGLALGLGCEVKGASSLLVLAEQARECLVIDGRLRPDEACGLVVARDARMAQAYWARYAWSLAAGWVCEQGEQLSSPQDIVVTEGESLILLHEQTAPRAANETAWFEPLRTQFAARWTTRQRLIVPALDAVALLRLAPRLNPCDVAELLPLYVRDKVADTTAEQVARRAASRIGQPMAAS